MGWEFLIPIIVREGIPAAYKLWSLAKQKGEPTDADWQELLALSRKTHDEYIAEAKGKTA